MPKLSLTSGQQVPSSGLYQVLHEAHPLPAQVTLLKGYTFPPCSECNAPVYFSQVRHMLHLDKLRGKIVLNILPVLRDEAA